MPLLPVALSPLQPVGAAANPNSTLSRKAEFDAAATQGPITAATHGRAVALLPALASAVRLRLIPPLPVAMSLLCGQVP